MKQKALKYTILFLLIPLFLSLFIAIATDSQGFKDDNTGYNGLEIRNEQKNEELEIKRSNNYTYLSLFAFLVIGGTSLIYIKSKRGI